MSDWTTEPWIAERNFVMTTQREGIAICEPRYRGGARGEVEYQHAERNAKRISECVSALAGRVPEKLAALEDAVSLLIDERDVERALQALAAFRGEL